MLNVFGEYDNIPYDRIKSMITVGELTPKVIKNSRFFVLGPAKSGKDTLAVALSKYLRLGGMIIEYKGSTSLTMLPYVYGIFEKIDPALACQIGYRDFFEERVNCRVFWYNVIKAYRELDPFFIINEDNADIFVGSRDWGEIKSCVDCTNNSYFILCRADGSIDPTWPYTYDESHRRIENDFGVSPHDIVTFDYFDSNFELFLSIAETAKQIGSITGQSVSFIARDNCNFERHGVRFDDVLKGRF